MYSFFGALFLLAYGFLSDCDDLSPGFVQDSLASTLDLKSSRLKALGWCLLESLKFEVFLSEEQFSKKMKIIDRRLAKVQPSASMEPEAAPQVPPRREEASQSALVLKERAGSRGKSLMVEMGCMPETQKGMSLSPPQNLLTGKHRRMSSAHSNEKMDLASQSCEPETATTNASP